MKDVENHMSPNQKNKLDEKVMMMDHAKDEKQSSGTEKAHSDDKHSMSEDNYSDDWGDMNDLMKE